MRKGQAGGQSRERGGGSLSWEHNPGLKAVSWHEVLDSSKEPENVIELFRFKHERH